MDLQKEFSLKDKVIVVTGGTGILGEAFIKGIANAGGIVGILGRNETVANYRASAINAEGGKAIALIADVTNEEQLVKANDKVLDAYGKIDGLVNAAGGNIAGCCCSIRPGYFRAEFYSHKRCIQFKFIRYAFAYANIW